MAAAVSVNTKADPKVVDLVECNRLLLQAKRSADFKIVITKIPFEDAVLLS